MLSENGKTPSMSASGGGGYNNACMESFFASFKKEMAYRRNFKDIEDVREAAFRYIELFYNWKRFHSSLEYMTPVEYGFSKQAALTTKEYLLTRKKDIFNSTSNHFFAKSSSNLFVESFYD